MEPRELERRLKRQEIAPVVFLWGEESWLVDEAISRSRPSSSTQRRERSIARCFTAMKPRHRRLSPQRKPCPGWDRSAWCW